jgi:hypothetical protein
MKKIIFRPLTYRRALARFALFRFLIGIALLFVATMVLSAHARAKPQAPAFGILILVDSTGDGANMGSGNVCDDGTGHCTLRAAIQLVNGRNNGGDTISISVTGTISLSSALPNLNVPVSIRGINLRGVSDGTNTGLVSIPMGVLAGDTTDDASVNSADISQTKSKSGQAVDSSNFRNDVTVDGSLNSADISLVKSKSGTGLP